MNVKNLRVILISILLLSIYSCSQEKVTLTKLLGKWKVTRYNANFKDINQEIVREAKEIALSGTYIFQKGSTYLYESKFDKFRGTWSFDESKNQIKMNFSSKYNKNGKEEYEIIRFNTVQMTWKSSSGLGTEEITLTKK